MKIDTAEFVRSVHDPSGFPRDRRPEIAFAGRSNVGKSSLLNRLLKRKRLARTSTTPGRTRCVNYFLINGRFYFVDLPGYGYARAAKRERRAWAGLTESYFRRPDAPMTVVVLVDGKVGATELDEQALDYLLHVEVPVIVVATKIDKISRNRRAVQLGEIAESLGLPEDAPPIAVSAQTGEGLKDLWNTIELRL